MMSDHKSLDMDLSMTMSNAQDLTNTDFQDVFLIDAVGLGCIEEDENSSDTLKISDNINVDCDSSSGFGCSKAAFAGFGDFGGFGGDQVGEQLDLVSLKSLTPLKPLKPLKCSGGEEEEVAYLTLSSVVTSCPGNAGGGEGEAETQVTWSLRQCNLPGGLRYMFWVPSGIRQDQGSSTSAVSLVHTHTQTPFHNQIQPHPLTFQGQTPTQSLVLSYEDYPGYPVYQDYQEFKGQGQGAEANTNTNAMQMQSDLYTGQELMLKGDSKDKVKVKKDSKDSKGSKPAPTGTNKPRRAYKRAGGRKEGELYKCSYCSKNFSQKAMAKRHEVVHEDGEFFCPHAACRIAFKYQSTLTIHVKRFHGDGGQRPALRPGPRPQGASATATASAGTSTSTSASSLPSLPASGSAPSVSALVSVSTT